MTLKWDPSMSVPEPEDPIEDAERFLKATAHREGTDRDLDHARAVIEALMDFIGMNL